MNDAKGPRALTLGCEVDLDGERYTITLRSRNVVSTVTRLT